VLHRKREVDAIVIEEFHRLLPPSQRAIMQLMKTLADRGGEVRLVAVGTRRIGDELMKDREYKDYIGRTITPVALPRMTNSELRDIIDRRLARGVGVDEQVAAGLVWVASGYPALVHRVMYDSSARWIRRNSYEAIASSVGAALAVVNPVAMLIPIVAMAFVSLRKAGVTVGPAEFSAVLAQYVAQFEREELGGKPIADPQTQQLLHEYAIADDEEYDLEALASRAGLTRSIAHRAWKEHAAQLLTENERRLLPGLRSYVRAKLLLGGYGPTSQLQPTLR
jgi:hypothetical protein